MTPLGVGAKLNLVDGEEVHFAVYWHCLNGANEVAGVGRNALLFTRYQRNVPFPHSSG